MWRDDGRESVRRDCGRERGRTNDKRRTKHITAPLDPKCTTPDLPDQRSSHSPHHGQDAHGAARWRWRAGSTTLTSISALFRISNSAHLILLFCQRCVSQWIRRAFRLVDTSAGARANERVCVCEGREGGQYHHPIKQPDKER
jgi:hypothetical protein